MDILFSRYNDKVNDLLIQIYHILLINFLNMLIYYLLDISEHHVITILIIIKWRIIDIVRLCNIIEWLTGISNVGL